MRYLHGSFIKCYLCIRYICYLSARFRPPSLAVRLGPYSQAKAEEHSQALNVPSSGTIRIEESGTYNSEAAWWVWVEGMENISSLTIK